MAPRILRVTVNGTGFAANYTAACYGLIPHRNGVAIELAGVQGLVVRRDVRDEVVPEEIEVLVHGVAAPLRAADHVAVERARLVPAPFRSSDLDVVEPDDHRGSNGCSTPRVTPGPE